MEPSSRYAIFAAVTPAAAFDLRHVAFPLRAIFIRLRDAAVLRFDTLSPMTCQHAAAAHFHAAAFLRRRAAAPRCRRLLMRFCC